MIQFQRETLDSTYLITKALQREILLRLPIWIHGDCNEVPELRKVDHIDRWRECRRDSETNLFGNLWQKAIQAMVVLSHAIQLFVHIVFNYTSTLVHAFVKVDHVVNERSDIL